MKSVIIDRETASIINTYDGEPNQAAYGGPWGDAQKTAHMELPTGFDPRWLIVTDNEDGTFSLAEDSGVKTTVQADDTKNSIINVISRARSFGDQLVNEFAAENVQLGIMTDNMTATVLDNMASVMTALQSGSLFEAIARAKAVPSGSKDAKYITDARLLEYVNKIETYLGVTLSTTL